MAGHLRSISVVSLSTLASRIAGLARDSLTFAVLGSGAVSSAFVLAFTLPNLLRRLMGEGALASAVIPMLSEAAEREGKPGAFRLTNAVLARLALMTTLTALGIALLTAGLLLIPGLEARWYLGGKMSLLLLPYLVMVCCAALVGATLNVFQRFAIPALGQVWLNLAMIGALFIGLFSGSENLLARAHWLCGGVLCGGLLQFGVTAWYLRREGWRLRGMGPADPVLFRRVWQLFLPGLAGASIVQVNVFTTRIFAYSIDDAAAGILYLATRLVEFPLGIFASAVSTVLFPVLARDVTRADPLSFARNYRGGAMTILAITIPAALGLALLAEPIMTFLFNWGLFTQDDVRQTVAPLAIYALSIPFYSWATLTTRCFHARQDMATPVRLSLYNFGVNLAASAVLMHPLGVTGLALANLLSISVHTWLLAHRLELPPDPEARRRTREGIWKILAAGLVMGLATYLGWWGLEHAVANFRLRAAMAVVGLIPLSVGLYFILLYALGLHEFRNLMTEMLAKVGRRSRV